MTPNDLRKIIDEAVLEILDGGDREAVLDQAVDRAMELYSKPKGRR